MAKAKETNNSNDSNNEPTVEPTVENTPAALREGYVEIELLVDHGNCKKGAKRPEKEAAAKVLEDNKIAKIITE